MRKKRASRNTGDNVRQAGPPAATAPKSRAARSLRPRWPALLVGISYLLAVTLTGAALYLWRAPLPPLPEVTSSRVDSGAASVAAGRGSADSLQICLRQLKMRDLFKPSIPVPTDDGLGKTTAQELADRLRFAGVMGKADHMAALVFIPNRGPGTFRVGDRIAEFVLKEVTAHRLVLGLGDEEAILKR